MPPDKRGPDGRRQLGLDYFWQRRAPSTTTPSSASQPTLSAPMPQAPRSKVTPLARSTGVKVVLGTVARIGANPYQQYRDVDVDELDHDYPEEAAADTKAPPKLSPHVHRYAAQAANPCSITNPVAPSLVSKSFSPGKPLKRKRGRPKGYRPSLVRRSDAHATPGTTDAEATPQEVIDEARHSRRAGDPSETVSYYPKKKKRGRPAKAPMPVSAREIYTAMPAGGVRFKVYLCEWQGCKAELHNCDTLRRHLEIVHMKGPGSECRWGTCAADADEVRQPAMTRIGLRKHIEQVHLQVQLWHMGDGPNNEIKSHKLEDQPEFKLPDYLFLKGEQVTPWAGALAIEDEQTRKERRRRLKQLLREREMQYVSSGDERVEEEQVEGDEAAESSLDDSTDTSSSEEEELSGDGELDVKLEGQMTTGTLPLRGITLSAFDRPLVSIEDS